MSTLSSPLSTPASKSLGQSRILRKTMNSQAVCTQWKMQNPTSYPSNSLKFSPTLPFKNCQWPSRIFKVYLEHEPAYSPSFWFPDWRTLSFLTNTCLSSIVSFEQWPGLLKLSNNISGVSTLQIFDLDCCFFYLTTEELLIFPILDQSIPDWVLLAFSNPSLMVFKS